MPYYRITHRTAYEHAGTAAAAWQALHLQPRNEPAQRCESFALELNPRPDDLAARTDYFGNVQQVFSLREAHDEMVIVSRSRVWREEPAAPLPGLTPALRDMRLAAAESVRRDFVLQQFLGASPLVPALPATGVLTDELTAGLDPGRPILNWLAEVGRRFHAAFVFDPAATRVSTPLTQVLEQRRGVCQDFAHVLIACLRQAGIPASYVSGYLLTRPPPGQPRLIGADASHAWVAAWIPGTGWVDYDPTNAGFAGAGHIVVARGRDFSDVSPVKGLFSGGGGHTLRTGVTVEPE